MKFDICACAEEKELDLMMLDLLEYFAEKDKDLNAFVAQSEYHSKGTFYLIGHYLDTRDFIGHGVSLRQGWLTDKGTKILKELRDEYIDK